MPPNGLAIRQRGTQRSGLEAPQSHRAIDDVPIRNSFTPSRHTAGPSTARPAPASARRPTELSQRSRYPTLPTESYTNPANAGRQRPSLQTSVSQPQHVVDSVTASASWDLDAAEYSALSQPESSYVEDDGSGDDPCSPTLSDLDALEESLYEYEKQFSQADTASSQSSSQDVTVSVAAAASCTVAEPKFTQTASSANYNKYSESPSSIPTSIASLPSSTEDLGQSSSSSIEDRLRLVWPKHPQAGLANAPLVVLWELTRVALHCDVDLAHVDLRYAESWNNQNTLWDVLKMHPSFRGKRLPIKSDPLAWRDGLYHNFESDGGAAVLLTATMHATKTRVGPAMKLELHPLKRELGSRLFRRFGSDRFLEIRIPSVDSWLPDGEAVVASWLATQSHPFIGRQWSAFFIRDRSEKSLDPNAKEGPEAKVIFNERVLFFAESGKDLKARPLRYIPPKRECKVVRSACARNRMLDWLLSFEMNSKESYLKLFSRIALGLSKTSPVLVLEKHQIRRQSKDLEAPNGEPMNDGVGRISPSLMRKVRDELGLQSIPSAVQGRLGSAKGMWLIDMTDQSHEDWIETYPKQEKWECNWSDEDHRTLEVRSCSMNLTSASLNRQFLPILEDRANDVDRIRKVFVRNMDIKSEEENENLKLALQHLELFRKWIRESNQSNSLRLSTRGMPFLASLPDSPEDIMSFLVDGGFDPMKLKFLQTLAFQLQKQKGDKIKEALNIKIKKSTYAYMVVDFWGILEPDEVHLCFSSKFNDGTDELSDLDGLDILVGRCPAHLPSDIQKVRATFKPELRHLRDVIIFSSKGDIPLASKLSGGDYDGDHAWVCWDPDIVGNFENAAVPPKPDFSPYIRKDRDRLSDLRAQYGRDQYIDAMVEKAFGFSLKPKLLGPCTSFKEKLAYDLNAVSNEKVIKLSWLLSELADQPKQGILFGREEWNRFRVDVVGSRRELPLPTYKNTNGFTRGPGAKHIIDYLTHASKTVVDGALANLHKFMEASQASFLDRDVAGYWEHFERTFGNPDRRGIPRAAWFLALRDGLRSDVEACHDEWRKAMALKNQVDYRTKVEYIYGIWRAIKPRIAPEEVSDPLADPARKFLLQDGLVVPELSQWELVKASWAYKHYHHQRPYVGRFVWQMAGRQLQAIKALAVQSRPAGDAVPILVVPNMYAALRPDNTYIKRR
ncbi:putative RNA-dependent RNA polymerase SHL2 [Cytospora mali]|uniref:RNA-dependent RNA polymerase n=1 Tax=Cytospora mali TaxID=578113 RepID=A0A194W825_CYTMA|nr:putative RNA-dependent RNA polymerase SHL2 [Valsa mali]